MIHSHSHFISALGYLLVSVWVLGWWALTVYAVKEHAYFGAFLCFFFGLAGFKAL